MDMNPEDMLKSFLGQILGQHMTKLLGHTIQQDMDRAKEANVPYSSWACGLFEALCINLVSAIVMVAKDDQKKQDEMLTMAFDMMVEHLADIRKESPAAQVDDLLKGLKKPEEPK